MARVKEPPRHLLVADAPLEEAVLARRRGLPHVRLHPGRQELPQLILPHGEVPVTVGVPDLSRMHVRRLLAASSSAECSASSASCLATNATTEAVTEVGSSVRKGPSIRTVPHCTAQLRRVPARPCSSHAGRPLS
jgi:hypothetical protein